MAKVTAKMRKRYILELSAADMAALDALMHFVNSTQELEEEFNKRYADAANYHARLDGIREAIDPSLELDIYHTAIDWDD